MVPGRCPDILWQRDKLTVQSTIRRRTQGKETQELGSGGRLVLHSQEAGTSER
jgi:hypothetical protein